MSLENVKIGIAFTGSFCTYNSVFPELEKLAEENKQSWYRTAADFENFKKSC